MSVEIQNTIAEEDFMQGRIKWYDHAKGFGFITPLDGSQDVFLHESELSPENLAVLADGDAVDFETMAARLGPAATQVRRVDTSEVSRNPGHPASAVASMPPAGVSGDVLAFLRTHERASLGGDNMSEEQKRVLLSWGMRMYGLGQHRIANIEAVKYDGRLIVLDDGSRWEVNSTDHVTASMWSGYERVVVIDDRMFLLDENEAIRVDEETG